MYVQLPSIFLPSSGIIAVSSQVEKPNEAVLELYDDRNPPAPFKTGILDPNIPKFYLLLHDGQTDNALYADNVSTCCCRDF